MSKKAIVRAYHHGNLRAAVLQEAERVLESGGVSSVSIREISRALNVSHTAPRRHFATKQALLDALAIEGYAQLGKLLSSALRHHNINSTLREQGSLPARIIRRRKGSLSKRVQSNW